MRKITGLISKVVVKVKGENLCKSLSTVPSVHLFMSSLHNSSNEHFFSLSTKSFKKKPMAQISKIPLLFF
jgi:hypothetical protein